MIYEQNQKGVNHIPKFGSPYGKLHSLYFRELFNSNTFVLHNCILISSKTRIASYLIGSMPTAGTFFVTINFNRFLVVGKIITGSKMLASGRVVAPFIRTSLCIPSKVKSHLIRIKRKKYLP